MRASPDQAARTGAARRAGSDSVTGEVSTTAPANSPGARSKGTAGETPAGKGSGPEIGALQAVLAAEQAATYGYGVVGAHLAGTALAAATAAWTVHQVAADRLAAALRARGATPAAAAVAYQLPHRVSTPAQAAALAATLEDQLTSVYLGLVALRSQSLRMLGARQVRAAALRAAAWRGATVPFPGLQASAPTRPPGAVASRG